MAAELFRESEFTTVDGTVSLRARCQRPDRFGHIALPDKDTVRIARGGGYSYSAASFGEASLVQDMTCFDRFLAFDPDSLTLKVEPGVRLIDVLDWALPRQLYFPVLPGYPLVTIGGCVAADVHGKNPHRDGSFARWVRGLTVYHPVHGMQECTPQQNAGLFQLSCGGFGLTGLITQVTLQLTKLPSNSLDISRQRVSGLSEAASALADSDTDIAYSWHDASPGASFGRGVLYTGNWSDSVAPYSPLSFKAMTAANRGVLPFSLWNGLTSRAANAALYHLSGLGDPVQRKGLLKASFPFASNVYFHQFFGRAGLREVQVLVKQDRLAGFLDGLEKLVAEFRASSMMLSMKRFRGEQRALSMSGDGYLVAMDCYRGPRTDDFLAQFDRLMLDAGAQPNLAKDARLPGEVAQQSLPHLATFREKLFDYDPDRLMRSELSRRLGLL